MQEFKRIQATDYSISIRKPIYGIGINDSDYIVQPTVNGKRVICPAYRAWFSMFVRCYSKNKTSAYDGCYVCDEWLLFSNFIPWFNNNYIKGYQLDKDIKEKGNKIYSPEKCLYVPVAINSLFTGYNNKTRKHSLGVDYKESEGKFRASVLSNGKQRFLGYFDTDKEASLAYLKGKDEEIRLIIKDHPEFACYLERHLTYICGGNKNA